MKRESSNNAGKQIEHGLRALFNNLGASLWPDVLIFTEHPVVELGHGVGPFYETPDEAKVLGFLEEAPR